MKASSAILGVASLIVSALVHADSSTVGLDKISLYAGTWKSEVETLDTQYSRAGKKTKTITNNCWRATSYYTCEQIVDGKPAGLIVFTYHADDDSYSSYAIPGDGKDAPVGKLIIKGSIWTYPWHTTYKGKVVYLRILNVFESAISIEYSEEASDDDQHWTLLARGVETRVN